MIQSCPWRKLISPNSGTNPVPWTSPSLKDYGLNKLTSISLLLTKRYYDTILSCSLPDKVVCIEYACDASWSPVSGVEGKRSR